MKRSICTILMVALLVLPAGSLGVAQDGPPQPEAVAPGWGLAAEPAAMDRGEVDEYEPWQAPPGPRPQAIITVTTTDDELNSDGDCALREAIQAANTDAAVDACVAGSGDDTVVVPSGTYTLTIPGAYEDNNQTGDLDILDNLELSGDGADTTILDGNQLDRVLHIHPGRTVEINDVTVTHGSVEDESGGGIRNWGGTLTLNDVVLRENEVTHVLYNVGGGGLYSRAVYQDATVTLNNCLVVENTAYGGGGILDSVAGGLTSTVTLNHTTVSTNTAERSGGGIRHTMVAGATDATSIMNLYNSVVEGNTAQLQGGGIVAYGYPPDNVITTLTVDHSTIHGNTAAGIDTYSGRGGGLWVESSQATLVASTVSGNTASGNAYGSGFGGGLSILGGTAEVVNSTISGNQASGSSVPNASGFGGGVVAAGGGFPVTLTLSNTTVAENSSNVGGGGVVVANFGMDATITFKNSVVGDNSAPSGFGESCFTHDWGFGPGTFTSLGHNLEDYDTCEFDQPSDWINTDPLLGPLQDNGGETWTHALLGGSPAIDAGDDAAAPPTDQRGVPRPQGPASDIGSYEANILVNTCDDELNSDGDCSLREAIEAANTDTAVDACLAGLGHDYLTLPPCTYTLAIPGVGEDNNQTGDLDILDDLTIYGAGVDTTVIDGNDLDRVLHILDGSVVEVNDLAIANGRVIDEHGGGIFNARSNLTLNNTILSENEVVSTGGTLAGGGLANGARYGGDATTTLNNCLVIENTAYGGGGLMNAADTGLTATLTLSNTTVVSNTAESWGGGIEQSRFAGATDAMAIMNLHNSVVEGNTAQVAGGGIDTSGVPADNVVATLTVDHSTIRGNTVAGSGDSTGNGGGIYAYGSTVTLVGSTLSDNSSSGVGFETGWGGGLFLMDSPTTVVNSTVSGNEASGSGLPDMSGGGGGIVIAGASIETSLTLTNTSVVSNTSNVAGGGIVVGNLGSGAEATFKNSLVGRNTAPTDFGESCFTYDFGFGLGTFNSLGHNLEDYNYCQFDQPTDLPNTDPILGPLQDNGGPTWTHALLTGSPAIDAGDDDACPPTDQRGVPRPQGPHCDISAFEAFDTTPPTIVAVNPHGGATDVALDATVVITFSEPISVPTFAYSVAPDPGGWTESWGPNDTVVSLTHGGFAYDTAYTATVSAAEDRAGNPMAAPYAWSFTTVAEPCDPVETVTVEGPASLRVGETGVYSATYAPITATLPVTLTWGDGTVGATATYSWTLPGTYTLTVTATNPCGEAVASFPVEVSEEAMYWIFLPLVVKDMP
jgi:fibronectin-binding autotransporter adhesin